MRHLALGMLVGSVAWTHAFDEKIITVVNTTGVPASDLHVTFSGTGGNVFVSPPGVYAFGCPVPLVPSNGMVTNTVVIDWGVPCVMPGQAVAFKVRTNNGPLTFIHGFWTFGGNNIGRVSNAGIRQRPLPPPPPPPPPRPWLANKWQSKCLWRGKVLFTSWMGLPGTPCWVRWVCYPGGKQITRKVRCWFEKKGKRVVETRCRVVVPWFVSGKYAPKYFWQRTTIRPPDLNRPGNIAIAGPPKNGLRGPVRWGTSLPFSLDPRYSDDGGENFRYATDFSKTFLSIHEGMLVTSEVPLPGPTFSETVQLLAPGYLRGALELDSLLNEIQLVLIDEPTSEVGAVVPALTQMRDGMRLIGNDMADGTVTDVLAFELFEQGLSQLADSLPALGPEPRFGNAALLTESIREGAFAAKREVLLGLPNQASQDYFLWALMNRITKDMAVLGHAMGPHTGFKLGIGDHGWEPSELLGARTVVRNAVTGEVLDQSTLPVSSDGTVIVPTYGYEEDHENIVIDLRFDTFLPIRRLQPSADSSLMPVLLLNGDVNGDSAINLFDANRVIADLGQGGATATEVPETDLNDDGIVNLLDVVLVQHNLGATVESFFDVFFEVNLEDYGGSPTDEELDVEVTDPTGNVHRQQMFIHDDGTASISAFMAGPHTVRVKGRKWISSLGAFTVAPGALPTVSLSLRNGDIDGDNEVGPGDFGVLANSFLAMPGEPNFEVNADLDGDGEVGPGDFDILARNFLLSGD